MYTNDAMMGCNKCLGKCFDRLSMRFYAVFALSLSKSRCFDRLSMRFYAVFTLSLSKGENYYSSKNSNHTPSGERTAKTFTKPYGAISSIESPVVMRLLAETCAKYSSIPSTGKRYISKPRFGGTALVERSSPYNPSN